MIDLSFLTNVLGMLSPSNFVVGAQDSYNAISCLVQNGFSAGCPSIVNTAFSGDFANSLVSPLGYFGSALGQVINFFWYFIPDGGGFPTVVHSAALSLGGAMANLAFILPVHDLVTILFLLFSIRAVLIVYYLTKVVVGLVRGVPFPNRF